MTIRFAETLKQALPGLKTHPEVTQLCREAMAAVTLQTFNNWIFTRYMREVEFTTCTHRYTGVALNSPGMSGQRTAVGVAMFDKGELGNILVGGAASHPSDPWNRHLGRTVATLRVYRVPIELAAIWSVCQSPWDLDNIIDPRSLMPTKWREPWRQLEKNHIPTSAIPAVVDAARQAFHHVLMSVGNARIAIQGSDRYRSIVPPDSLGHNAVIASQLVDAACKLPGSLPLTAEQRTNLAEKGRAKWLAMPSHMREEHREPDAGAPAAPAAPTIKMEPYVRGNT